MRCLHLSLHWMLSSTPTDALYYFLRPPKPNSSHICSLAGQVPSEARHDSSTEPLPRFNCPPGLGGGWAFSPGGNEERWVTRTVAVSPAGVERGDGEWADKLTAGSQTVGSRSATWEQRWLYVRGRLTGGIHLPTPALLRSLIHITHLLSAALLADTNLQKEQRVVWPLLDLYSVTGTGLCWQIREHVFPSLSPAAERQRWTVRCCVCPSEPLDRRF